MFLETVARGKVLATLSAVIWPVPCVGAFVLFKHPDVDKTFVALRARKQTFPCMHAFVYLELSPCSKTLATLSTHVRLPFIVSVLVCFQPCLICVSLAALGTSVQPFCHVIAQVRYQISAKSETLLCLLCPQCGHWCRLKLSS